MKISTTTTTTVFYTVATAEGEINFSTVWEMIAFISKIDLEVQLN